MELIILLMVLAMLVISAIISAIIGSKNGRSGFGFFILGFILGPIGVAIALIAGPNSEKIEINEISSGVLIKCPACAEKIKIDANICRYCQSNLDEQTWIIKINEKNNVNCPRCRGAVVLDIHDLAAKFFDCPLCTKHVFFRKS